MESVGGIVVETREYIAFWHCDWLAAGTTWLSICCKGKSTTPVVLYTKEGGL